MVPVRWLWQPGRRQLRWKCAAGADKVEQILRAATASNGAVRGVVRTRSVRIERQPGVSQSRPTFSPVFYGVIEEAKDGGSQLSGHFQLNPVSRLFLGVWFACGIVLALGFVILGLTRATPDSSAADALPYLWPTLLPITGWAVLRWQGRRVAADEDALESWLATILREKAGLAMSTQKIERDER